jgi:hypothetical protein
VVAGDAAWFTDSFQPQLYRVPLVDGGVGDPETIPLSGPAGDFGAGFNLNGIEAEGGELIVVNSSKRELYAVEPDGASRSIDLGGDVVTAGDGLLLVGRRLYVVRNQLDQVDIVELSPDLSSGEVTGSITSDLFDVPTTAAKHGNRLMLVNARFGQVPDPTTPISTWSRCPSAESARSIEAYDPMIVASLCNSPCSPRCERVDMRCAAMCSASRPTPPTRAELSVLRKSRPMK